LRKEEKMRERERERERTLWKVTNRGRNSLKRREVLLRKLSYTTLKDAVMRN
jgi:hypothetical protein